MRLIFEGKEYRFSWQYETVEEEDADEEEAPTQPEPEEAEGAV